MQRGLKVAFPLLLIGAGLWGAWFIFVTAPQIEEQRPQPVAPLIRVVEVAAQRLQVRVQTNGTVSPRTESHLVPQVSGTVVWVSPSLISGGFFEEGDLLLRIDPHDYQVALERARAALARAGSEHQRAGKERTRLRGLAERGVVSESQLDDAERAERVAAASLRETQAILAQAERDLARTEIAAPFAGRVREERVDVGQFVARGAPVGTLYAIDYAEVRLPVADDELAFLELPPWHRAGADGRLGPEVVLRASYAGAEHEWRGQVVRTEGEIDARSRMINIVARVEDPYGRQQADARTPLSVGLFVRAEILGKTLDDVVVVPRAALRNPGELVVVDADDRLRIRPVKVIRRGRRRAVIAAADLGPADRVVTAFLETAVDGMQVRPVVEAEAAAAQEQGGL